MIKRVFFALLAAWLVAGVVAWVPTSAPAPRPAVRIVSDNPADTEPTGTAPAATLRESAANFMAAVGQFTVAVGDLTKSLAAATPAPVMGILTVLAVVGVIILLLQQRGRD